MMLASKSGQWGMRLGLAIGGLLLGHTMAIAETITTVSSGGQLTAPGGITKITYTTSTGAQASEYWMSDHAQGFCRVNLATGALSSCVTNALAPGQAAYFEYTTNLGNKVRYVYVPDLSSKSQGVWRFTYNPPSGTRSSSLSGATQLKCLNVAGSGCESGLVGSKNTRPPAVALSSNGKQLYVGYLRSPNIVRVTISTDANGVPLASNLTTAIVGSTSDGRGVKAGFALTTHDNLYIAEGASVSVIEGISSCVSGCTASDAGFRVASSPIGAGGFSVQPTAIAAQGDLVVVSDLSGQVDVYNPATTFSTYLAGASTSFRNISALAGDRVTLGADDTVTDGTVWIADDPSAGTLVLQGRFFRGALP